MIALGLFAAFVVLVMIMAWATGDGRTKPKKTPEPSHHEGSSPPAHAGPVSKTTIRPDEGRGAYAILNEARRAKALALPGQSAPKGTTYHVVRLSSSRELAVMHRTNGERATDRIVKHFPADQGIQAWRERNRRQYGRTS